MFQMSIDRPHIYITPCLDMMQLHLIPIKQYLFRLGDMDMVIPCLLASVVAEWCKVPVQVKCRGASVAAR